MRKRAIGLEITDQAVFVVELQKDRKQIEVSRGTVVQIPRNVIVAGELRDVPVLAEQIHTLVRTGTIGREVPVVLGISGIQAFIRKFTTPRVSLKELDQIVRWEGENILPYRIPEVVYDYQILKQTVDGYEVLFAAVHHERIDPYLQLIKELNIAVEFLTLQPFGMINYLEQLEQIFDYTGILARLRYTSVDVIVFLHGEIELIRTVAPGFVLQSEEDLLEFFLSELHVTVEHLQATREIWINTGLFLGESDVLRKVRAKTPAFHWRHLTLERRPVEDAKSRVFHPGIAHELSCAFGLGLVVSKVL